MAINGHEEEQQGDFDIYDSSSEDDSSSSSGSSSSGSSSASSSSSGSSSSSSSDDSDTSGAEDGDEDENFEIGFWESFKAALPWTELGKEVRQKIQASAVPLLPIVCVRVLSARVALTGGRSTQEPPSLSFLLLLPSSVHALILPGGGLSVISFRVEYCIILAVRDGNIRDNIDIPLYHAILRMHGARLEYEATGLCAVPDRRAPSILHGRANDVDYRVNL